MNSLQQIDTSRHEYRLKGWQRGLYVVLGAAMAAFGIFFTFIAGTKSDGLLGVLIALFFIGIGFYVLVYALRSRLVIVGTRIEVRNVFQERSADLSEIEGFRSVNSRNGSYIQFWLKEGRGKFSMSNSFDTDDDFRAWFQQVPDLDARDRDLLLSEISQQQDLGATPEERLAALSQAKTWSTFAIVISVAAALGLNLGLASIQLPCALLLALMPVAVFYLVGNSPLLYAVLKRKTDPRADLGFALMAAGFGLFFRVRDLEFVSTRPVFTLAALVALVLLAAFFTSGLRNSSPPGAVFGLLFIAAMFAYGLVVVADTLDDHSAAAAYLTTVTGKHLSKGKSTTYYLELAPWGPIQQPNKITVGHDVYSVTPIDGLVCLELRPGRLRIPWYQLADCPAQPDAGATH